MVSKYNGSIHHTEPQSHQVLAQERSHTAGSSSLNQQRKGVEMEKAFSVSGNKTEAGEATLDSVPF